LVDDHDHDAVDDDHDDDVAVSDDDAVADDDDAVAVSDDDAIADDAVAVADDDADAIAVAVAQQKWLRQLDECEYHDTWFPLQPVEAPVTTEQPATMPQATDGVMKELMVEGATDGVMVEKAMTEGTTVGVTAKGAKDGALVEEAAVGVIMVSATSGQPPPLPPRRAGSRKPATDYSGQPCGCGCGKVLEYKEYKTCRQCENEYSSIASNKIRVTCWGSGKRCIECNGKNVVAGAMGRM